MNGFDFLNAPAMQASSPQLKQGVREYSPQMPSPASMGNISTDKKKSVRCRCKKFSIDDPDSREEYEEVLNMIQTPDEEGRMVCILDRTKHFTREGEAIILLEWMIYQAFTPKKKAGGDEDA